MNIQVSTEAIVKQLLPEIACMVKEEVQSQQVFTGYYTAKQVCEELQISSATLWRRCKDGRLKYENFGRCKRFPKTQFE